MFVFSAVCLCTSLREFSVASAFAMNSFGNICTSEMFWAMVYVNRTTHRCSEVRWKRRFPAKIGRKETWVNLSIPCMKWHCTSKLNCPFPSFVLKFCFVLFLFCYALSAVLFVLRVFSAVLSFSVNSFGNSGLPELFWAIVYVNRTTHRCSEVRWKRSGFAEFAGRKHGKPLLNIMQFIDNVFCNYSLFPSFVFLYCFL